ncbi:MAG: TIM barrel protein [Nanoarchaeota archaeon]
MTWEPHWGICSWGYKMVAPNDIACFREVVLFMNEDLNFPNSLKPRVIEVFASMAEEGHEENLIVGAEMQKFASNNNILLHACGFNPFYLNPGKKIPSPHLTSRDSAEQEAAARRIERGIEHAAVLAPPGKGILMGPSYCRHEYFGEKNAGLYDGERPLLVSTLKNRIAPFATARGARIALEPLNRSETYLIMPGDDATDIVREIDEKSIGLNVDTVHWDLEADGSLEESLDKVFRTGYVLDFHLSDSHRKKWGSGSIGSRAEAIFRVVSKTGYVGPIVQEDFCPDLHSALKIWRPNKLSPSDVIKYGVETTRKNYGKIYDLTTQRLL